jgi:hypothetical protein
MPEDSMRSIASDVALISIALIAANFVLMALAWKGFEPRVLPLSHPQRKELFKGVLISLIPLSPLAAATVAGIYWPTHVQASAFLVMLLLAVMSGIYLIILGVRSLIRHLLKRNDGSPSTKIDGQAWLYSQTLMFLVLSTTCIAGALMLTITSALAIEVHPNQEEHFNWARWLLWDGVLLFVFGMFALGVAHLDSSAGLGRRVRRVRVVKIFNHPVLIHFSRAFCGATGMIIWS